MNYNSKNSGKIVFDAKSLMQVLSFNKRKLKLKSKFKFFLAFHYNLTIVDINYKDYTSYLIVSN